ncbi:MAG: hypothetical protein ACYS0I_00160 [Planctomycetota bacterium]|jgi:hypothetical protein
MRKKLVVFVCVILSLQVSPSVVAICPPEVYLSDDAYHYDDFRDGKNDASYIEWWYFNLLDAKNDIQIIFHYSILNPDNYLDRGLASVGATVYTPQHIFSEVDSFATNMFYASDEEAHVEIGEDDTNFIEVIDHDTYHITGAIGDGRLFWNLIYEQQIDPWFARDREHVGLFPWEKMSWLVYMPGAYVTGYVVIDDETYYVNQAPGYHDHNWGEWIPIDVLWNWAQYFETGLAFEIGDFRYKPVGVVSVEFDGKRTVFEKNEYYLTHTRWGYDSENHKWFPSMTWLYAENEKKRLIVRMHTISTEALMSPLEMPQLLPEVILYEQTAYYVGQLWGKNHKGDWELLVKFRGKGFKEYSALKWAS